MNKDKVMLIVRDGWGFSEKKEGNAIAAAKVPFDDYLNSKYLPVILGAHGPAVGLPEGFQGSSEVGHMNMGAGKIVIQEVTRINELLESGEFYKSSNFRSILQKLNDNENATVHLMGLLQDEGVHSHQQHLFLLIKYFAVNYPRHQLVVHVFADGRDTPPKSTFTYLRELEKYLSGHGNAIIGTVMGRYYAMDRSKNWDLISLAYDAICYGKGERYDDLYATIKSKYENEVTPDNQPMFDEYLTPMINREYQGVNAGDVLINFNYRQDRAIQISKAFLDPDTPISSPFYENISYFGFTQYYDEFPYYLIDAISGDEESAVLVGKIIADAGLKQLRISETQKYRHVTSFFNGKLTNPFPGEERIEIPGSFDPSEFATHPEMNADDITTAVEKELGKEYDFIMINYANCDMVGHTGDFDAAVKAAEIVDANVKKVAEQALHLGYNVLITADHGNSEEMVDPITGEPKTSHTLNPVKLHLLSDKYVLHYASGKKSGILADIGTLILRMLKLPVPSEMDAMNIMLQQKQ